MVQAKYAGYNFEWKKQGSVTFSADRKNEVSEIFIISLSLSRGVRFRFKLLNLADSKVKYCNTIPDIHLIMAFSTFFLFTS